VILRERAGCKSEPRETVREKRYTKVSKKERSGEGVGIGLF
jgi:hypothetical protein